MKLAVHWAPSVTVCTPGWISPAAWAAEGTTSATNASARTSTNRRMKTLPLGRSSPTGARLCQNSASVDLQSHEVDHHGLAERFVNVGDEPLVQLRGQPLEVVGAG